MPGKRLGAEQIIPKLREAEVDLAKSLTVAQACKKHRCDGADVLPLAQGVRRHSDGPGQGPGEGECPVEADAELDKAILPEAASGNF
jgi:hypothetical protein